MAQQFHVQYIDDLDGTVLGDEANTIAFAFDGKDYTIDLSDENAAAFRDAMAPYVDAGHKQTAAKRRSARKSSGSAPTGNTKAIREWARANGHEISERGRIPADIMAAYSDAN